MNYFKEKVTIKPALKKSQASYLGTIVVLLNRERTPLTNLLVFTLRKKREDQYKLKRYQ